MTPETRQSDFCKTVTFQLATCVTVTLPWLDGPSYLEDVFNQVGADLKLPTRRQLHRVLTVIKVEALARGTNPSIVQAEVRVLYELLDGVSWTPKTATV